MKTNQNQVAETTAQRETGSDYEAPTLKIYRFKIENTRQMSTENDGGDTIISTDYTGADI